MTTNADPIIDFISPLRRFVRKRVADQHAADDIVQDVLLKTHASVETLPTDDRLAAWIFRTARNAIVDHYRASAVRRHADVNEIDPTDDLDGEDAGVMEEVSRCVRCMIDRLEPSYRDALKLADVDGLPQDEIAKRMNLSLSGAKSRVQRARQQLRGTLAACCDFERDARGNVIEYEPTDRARRTCGRCDTDACE